MKKNPLNIRRPIDFVIVGLMVIVTGCIIIFLFSINPLDFQKTNAKKSDIHMKKNHSAYPGIQIISEISNESNTPYAIHYPQTENKIFNDDVRHFVTNTKNTYLTLMKQTKHTGELNISFETFPYREHYYSFVLTTTISEANKQSTSTKTYLYNSKTGKNVSLSELLNNDDANLATLSKHVRSELTKNPSLKDHLLREQFHQLTQPLWENFQQFAIKDDALLIFFDENIIASKEIGSVTLPVSLSFINPILASEFQIEMQNMPTVSSTSQHTSTNVKRVALTFDDGPHPDVTPRILETLKAYNAKATFFMLGNRVQYYPDIVQTVLSNGHEIGNHTWGHPILTKLSTEQILSEFNKTEQAIFEATGQYPTVFRPPYGATNDFVESQLPIESTLWTIDSLDWKHRNAQQLLNITKQTMHNDAIILMHDIHHSTADAVNPLLAYLQQQGYEFVTVSEILADQ